MNLYDAHNHLQDDRFAHRQGEMLAACGRAGVTRMVVNGSCEADWPEVIALARQHPQIIPSVGYHPWYVRERSSDWEQRLTRTLAETPGAVVGEIGLDRWKPGLDYAGQEEVFTTQLRLAAGHSLPVSIHCLQAWGRLHDLLRAGPRPVCGFLLHSYGGPPEMIPALAKLGAYFSFPGYYAHARKARQRATFKQVPRDRLLIETDAPDQLPPDDWNDHPLANPATGQPVNHPANLAAIYRFVAGMFGEPVETLATRIEENFRRLFGPP